MYVRTHRVTFIKISPCRSAQRDIDINTDTHTTDTDMHAYMHTHNTHYRHSHTQLQTHMRSCAHMHILNNCAKVYIETDKLTNS